MLTFHSLKLLERTEIAEEAVSLVFAIPPELRAEYRHAAGQHVALRARLGGQEQRRTYSILGPASDDRLQLGIRVHAHGAMSRFLATELEIGQSIDVMTPGGSFVLPPATAVGRTCVAVAAGSGITPVLSIVAALLEHEPGSRVLLFYGNRTIARTMLLEDIQALKNRFLDRFAVFFVMSQEPQDVDLLNGRLDAQKLRTLATSVFTAADVDQYFLCVPAGDDGELADTLRDLGVPTARIHIERYLTGRPVEAGAATAPRPAATAAGTAEITVRMDGRRRSFTMPLAGEDSILEAAGAAGLELPYSCRAGVCSTCRTKVVRGKVEMAQNYALEDWEVEAGFVLCCQSRPLTPEIELTYDET